MTTPSLSFEPLPPRPTAVETCAAELERRILGGELPAGVRLPPERELAEMLGTSRVTVRSALSRLTDAHLLTVRQGSGYVVRDFRRGGGPDLLPGIVGLARRRDVAAIAADLLLVRRQLAAALLERLAGGITRPALERIRAAVDQLEARARAGADSSAIAEADVATVAALLEAIETPVLQLCLNPILSVLESMPELREATYAQPRTNVAGWRLLVEWLEHGGKRDVLPLVQAELERHDRATLARLSRRKKK